MIRDTQYNGRDMMLYAQHKCPESFTAKFWPYDIIHANNAYNGTQLLSNPQGLSPIQIFTGNQVQDNPNNWNLFGLPNCVLNESLRSSHQIHQKWKTRSKVGVYLRRSPIHNHDVALGLNRDYGLVIPQLHVSYEPIFTTIKDFDSSSLCQARSGFLDDRDKPSVALIGQPNVQNFPPIPLQKR